MERMKRLQEEREDGDTSQEEMTTRFEKETKESLFVVSGDTFHSFPHSGAFFPHYLLDHLQCFPCGILKMIVLPHSLYFFLVLCIIDGIPDTIASSIMLVHL